MLARREAENQAVKALQDKIAAEAAAQQQASELKEAHSKQQASILQTMAQAALQREAEEQRAAKELQACLLVETQTMELANQQSCAAEAARLAAAQRAEIDKQLLIQAQQNLEHENELLALVTQRLAVEKEANTALQAHMLAERLAIAAEQEKSAIEEAAFHRAADLAQALKLQRDAAALNMAKATEQHAEEQRLAALALQEQLRCEALASATASSCRPIQPGACSRRLR